MRRQIETSELTWIDIVNPTQEDLNFLAESFQFHQLDLQELEHRSPRPKMEEHPGYLFLVVHIPVHNVRDHSTFPAEVDIFATNKHLITVQLERVHILDQLFRRVDEDEELRKRHVGRGVAYLLYSVMGALTDASFPKLDHIMEKIEDVERSIFAGEERSMVFALSALKRDLSGFRQIIRPQIHIYDAGILSGEFASPLFKAVFRSIRSKLERVWGFLEILQEKVDALSDTNSTLLSHKLNEFIKIITVLGALFAPLILIAEFIVTPLQGVPLVNIIIFWGIITLMLIVDFVILWNYHQRKLL